MNTAIFEKMVALRKESGLSQEKVARKIDISMRQYQRIEYGKQHPSFETLVCLADLYQVSLDYLVGRSSKREITDPISTPQSETQFRD